MATGKPQTAFLRPVAYFPVERRHSGPSIGRTAKKKPAAEAAGVRRFSHTGESHGLPEVLQSPGRTMEEDVTVVVDRGKTVVEKGR